MRHLSYDSVLVASQSGMTGGVAILSRVADTENSAPSEPDI